MKSAITTALQSGARVILSAPGYGNNPLTLWNGEVMLADGDIMLESLFLAAMECGPAAAAWGVKLSIEF